MDRVKAETLFSAISKPGKKYRKICNAYYFPNLHYVLRFTLMSRSILISSSEIMFHDVTMMKTNLMRQLLSKKILSLELLLLKIIEI